MYCSFEFIIQKYELTHTIKVSFENKNKISTVRSYICMNICIHYFHICTVTKNLVEGGGEGLSDGLLFYFGYNN